MTIPRSARDIAINLVSQLIWVIMVAGSTATLIYLFGTTDVSDLAQARVELPAISILLAALALLVGGVLLLTVQRKASVVRGRELATRSNLQLLCARRNVHMNERVIRSTRFGSWPPAEVLEHRSAFRKELDRAILEEGADVRRIWNVSSPGDVSRLREVLARYEGRPNHSIRAYFGLPDHALPELLVVDGPGASMSFPSMRTPRGLDWMVRFRRRDLIDVVRDYFDVLWDRADRVLDAGERTNHCDRLLREAEKQLGTSPDGRK